MNPNIKNIILVVVIVVLALAINASCLYGETHSFESSLLSGHLYWVMPKTIQIFLEDVEGLERIEYAHVKKAILELIELCKTDSNTLQNGIIIDIREWEDDFDPNWMGVLQYYKVIKKLTVKRTTITSNIVQTAKILYTHRKTKN